MRRTLITVPMKELGASKTRLADTLSTPQREMLVRRLYARTLRFLAPIAREAGAALSVVTASAEAREMARAEGIVAIQEPAERSLSAAVGQAARWGAEAGFERLCVIPADLAVPEAADIAALLAIDADLAVCPATDMGTNAMVLPLPAPFAFQYGERSALKHLEAGRRAGLRTMRLDLESLSFDIDTAACLARAARYAPELAVA